MKCKSTKDEYNRTSYSWKNEGYPNLFYPFNVHFARKEIMSKLAKRSLKYTDSKSLENFKVITKEQWKENGLVTF